MNLLVFSHNALPVEWSDLVSAGAQLGQNHVDALLVYRAQAGIAHTHVHPAVFALDPEAAVLQIGEKPALGLVIGMGHAVSSHRLLAAYFTSSRPDAFSHLRFRIMPPILATRRT